MKNGSSKNTKPPLKKEQRKIQDKHKGLCSENEARPPHKTVNPQRIRCQGEKRTWWPQQPFLLSSHNNSHPPLFIRERSRVTTDAWMTEFSTGRGSWSAHGPYISPSPPPPTHSLVSRNIWDRGIKSHWPEQLLRNNKEAWKMNKQDHSSFQPL